jgi:hypothetical protein
MWREKDKREGEPFKKDELKEEQGLNMRESNTSFLRDIKNNSINMEGEVSQGDIESDISYS